MTQSATDIPDHLTTAERTRIDALVQRSVHVIVANQASTGAYLASPSFPVYRYCWFRDGAFIADAMSRVGQGASADAFFGWCGRVLEARAGQIDSLVARRARREHIGSDELLPCRYTVDGCDAGEEWWEFQLDGYGTWLWALRAHLDRSGLALGDRRQAVELTVKYLTSFWDEPCYDWWEEHPTHLHTSTVAAVYAGLVAAAGLEIHPESIGAARRVAGEIRARVLDEGTRNGRLVKWLDGEDLDASLIACSTPFRLVAPDDALMTATVTALELTLAHGGVHRYAADTYYGGGEWLLLAALLGWHYAETGQLERAYAQLKWVAAHATRDGDLAEQVSEHLLAPECLQPWLDRWGPIATPLLWSHAMFITLAHELGLDGQPA